MNMPTALLQKDVTPDGGDYEIVRRVVEKISLDYRDQPSLEALAAEVGDTPTGLQKLFTRWAGLSPKAFLQAVTLDHARRLLDWACRCSIRLSNWACRDLVVCTIFLSRTRRFPRASTSRAVQA